MNRKHIKALLLLGVMGSLVTSAAAQINPLPFPPPTLINQDWVIYCWDPLVTKDPYSNDYGIEFQYDALFGAVMGVSGKVTFDTCFPTVVTMDMPGRLGFYVGVDPNQPIDNGGSVQDDIAGTPLDDGLGLTWGSYTGVSGNCAVAALMKGTSTTAQANAAFFGKGGLDTAYWGASDRYFIGACTESNVRMQLRVDVIGDAARCQWTLTNTATTAITEGLWFGQWVYMFGPQGPHAADYVTVPGLKPLNVDTRFTAAPNASATIPELQLPPYINFGMYQSWAYGLQVVLQPNAQIPDQTPVNGLDLGKNGFLLGSPTASDGAMNDVLLPDTFFDDLHYETNGGLIGGSDGYIEKWNATPVGAVGTGTETRTIIAYYRTTWGQSDYAKPYSAVIDAPQVIATAPGQPTTFQNAPFTVAVDIDDTRGFSQNDQSVPLEDIEIDLDLPPGMTDANNPASNHLVKFLNIVQPQTVAHVVFQVAVDPTLFGTQQYTVTINPNPGTSKVLNGSVVVATQPYLQLTGTANLVTAPWQFSSSDWATIIGASSGLVLDQDYQVFGWDALAQGYVLQTDPQRGFGSFIVSNQNVGFVPLGGNPQQPADLETGAPQIIMQPGWNLIANPYNYAIPIGQLVGVPESDNTTAYTFTELATLGYVSGSLAFWSPLTQAYEYTETFSDLIQPNTGYWIFVESDQPVTLEFYPVFQPYLPNLIDQHGAPKSKGKPSTVSGTPLWSLQLAARANGMIDGTTTIGQVADSKLTNLLTKFKAPTAPVKNAISSSIAVPKGKKTALLARALTSSSVGTQTWNWQVYTQNAGTVALTWPNMSSIPNNVSIKLVDASGTQHALRQTASYTFMGKAQGTQTFKLVVTTGPQLPVIENLSATSAASAANVSYTLSVNANSTVAVTQNGQVIATLVNNRSDKLGISKATWNYHDSANRKVKPGIYQVVVSSTPSGGVTALKSVSLTVH